MPSFVKALNSQVGRKVMTAVTGLLLLLFLIAHLAGNLTIFGGPDSFNLYTMKLEGLGWLLYLAEAGLAFLFIYHTILGVSIWWRKRKTRPEKYEIYDTKGGPSHYSIASKSMIYTGIIILVFLFIHLGTFKFGVTDPVTIGEEEARDLRALVIEKFSTPWYALGYTAVLLIFILHLSHGFWSAITSLGMKHNKFSLKMQMAAYALAILLMLGFIFIPLYIYFTGGTGALIAY
ncbi:MAG: succinate dehydrogenase cytochrome b subunit [Balneolaceae bacterium]